MAAIRSLSSRQLAPFSPLLGARPAGPGHRVGRQRTRVAAFWPGSGSKSDEEHTDDEIFTAAAVSKPISGGQGSHRAQAKHAVAATTAGPGDEPLPGQPTLFKFAAAFTFVTVGAFFIGAAVRKYILQPGGREAGDLADWSTDQPSKGRRRGGKGRGPPSVEELMRQRQGDSQPPPPSKRDALLSSAAVQVSREAAAATPAEQLAASESLWMACLAPQEGQALRLLMPMPDGGEERCVAVFQEEADGKAAQAALLRVAGVPTALRKRPAAGLLQDTASSGWAAAFYPAGSLQGALAAVEDAAAQQELLRQEGAGGSSRAEGESGTGGRKEEEEDHGPDAADLLFAVLQQQALLLGSGEVKAAVARAAEAAAAEAAKNVGASAAQAAAGSAAQQHQQAEAAGAAAAASQAATTQQQAAAPAAAPAAAAASSAAPAAAAWDPQTEKLQRPNAGPGWWRSLTVLHVPQLLYSDGGKGLMSVHVSMPRTLGSPEAASSSGGGSEGVGGGEEGPTQQLLVAFADIKDAEALADCPVQHPSRPTAIQVLSVPPEHLQRHAEANGCLVAALPAGALVLPAGVDYDGAVALVVDAVERQSFAELAARVAGSGSAPGRPS